MGARNIGIVTTWFERGAAYVSRQYRRVLETEHNVFIYARGGEAFGRGNADWDDAAVTWDPQGVMPAPNSMDLDAFDRWIQVNGIEVVLFNEQHWWEPVIRLAASRIVTGAYVDYYTKETAPFFGAYDFLVCNTNRHYGVFEEHPHALYIPWGTDLSLFKPESAEPVSPGVVTFFHSCGMNPPRKGTDLTLRAFAKVTGPARLVIHTQISLTGCLPELAELISRLESEGRLTIHEGSAPAPGLYRLGDVYVYPSRLDGIGLTMAEALACGLPVIASDNPPMNEFVDESNGALVPVTDFSVRGDGYYWPQCTVDIDGLAEAMASYVLKLEGLADARRRARDYAEKHLDWFRNAAGAAAFFSAADKYQSPSKDRALDAARRFERKRARSSPRAWASYYMPRTVRAARSAVRRLRGS